MSSRRRDFDRDHRHPFDRESRGAQRIADDDYFRPRGSQDFRPKPARGGPKPKLSQRDKKKADEYRAKKNETYGYDKIAEDINKILHPGFASLASAVKDLSLTTKTAKIVPISTIALGPMVQEGVNSIRSTVRQLPVAFNRFSFYRVALGMLDVRLYTQYKMRSRNARTGDAVFQENWIQPARRDMLLGQRIHLLSITNYINAVGNFIHNDTQFYVGVPKANSPYTVTIQNLSDCVNLAANGPIAVRRLFYRSNPFPFSQWRVEQLPNGQIDPTLTNGADICPANYGDEDFFNDLEIVKQTLSMSQRKFPKKIGDAIDYAAVGHRAVLVSAYNVEPRFRAVPEVNEDPQLHNMEGEVDSFWSAEGNITDQDFYYGSLMLTGLYENIPGNAHAFRNRCEDWSCLSGHTNALTNMRVHY